MANNPDNTLVDLRDAVKAARQYFTDLFSDEHYANVRLEEFSLSDDGNVWNVTLGYDVARDRTSAMLAEIGAGPKLVREYKTFEVDAHDGIVKAMKIRKV